MSHSEHPVTPHEEPQGASDEPVSVVAVAVLLFLLIGVGLLWVYSSFN